MARMNTVSTTVMKAISGLVTSPTAYRISGMKLNMVIASWYMK